MSIAHTLFVLTAVAVVGCESPQDKATDADEARRAADQQEAEIFQATDQKAFEVQQKANDDIARLAREGAKKIGEAEMGADRRDNEATQALWHARDQARADSARKLDGLDHDVAELRPRLEKALSTAAATTIVQDLQAKSATLRMRILDLDQCSAGDLESIKTSIHTGFADLEQALADAKKRV
jgi:hypothetical protein